MGVARLWSPAGCGLFAGDPDGFGERCPYAAHRYVAEPSSQVQPNGSREPSQASQPSPAACQGIVGYAQIFRN
jgi:hypothetical protein